jgi:hypothetical protein
LSGVDFWKVLSSKLAGAGKDVVSSPLSYLVEDQGDLARGAVVLLCPSFSLRTMRTSVDLIAHTPALALAAGRCEAAKVFEGAFTC